MKKFLAVIGLALALVLGSATQGASAHTPTVTQDCTGFTINLTSYAPAGNWVKVTIDGETLQPVQFGATYKKFYPLDVTKAHAWLIQINAVDGAGYNKTITGKSDPKCIPVPEKPKPTTEYKHYSEKDCTTLIVREVTVELTTDWKLVDNKWVSYQLPPVTTHVDREATKLECPPALPPTETRSVTTETKPTCKNLFVTTTTKNYKTEYILDADNNIVKQPEVLVNSTSEKRAAKKSEVKALDCPVKTDKPKDDDKDKTVPVANISGNLPHTGFNDGQLPLFAGAGALTLLLGGALLVAARRTRTN